MNDSVILGIDVETVGGPGAICELAVSAVSPDGCDLGHFEALVDPGDVTWQQAATRLHGISAAAVAGKQSLDAAWSEMIEWMRGLGESRFEVFAHNAGFERGVLGNQLQPDAERLDIKCSMQLARTRLPDLGEHALDVVCEEIGVPLLNHHRALPDAWASAHIARLLIHGGNRPSSPPMPRPLDEPTGWTSNGARGSNPALRAETEVISSRLAGEVVVFTGTPYSVKDRTDLKRLAIAHGADVADNVSRRTTVLVVAGHRGHVPEGALGKSKGRRALEFNCLIMSEEEFLAQINGSVPV
jgi:DNA polymerase III epsilon subunit-like protein